jgi:Protein of unknown function (DUF2889)
MTAPDFDRTADAYRRRIVVETTQPGVAVADLEDDFHHFVVTLRHDGERVVEVSCESERWPWATCPGAAVHLRALEGMPLSRRFTAAGTHTDPKQNCTHQFDAACYAITHAAWGRDRRVYDVELPLRRFGDNASVRARLWVDGDARLTWMISWQGIENPQPPFDAAPWKGGFMRWADANLDEEAAEDAITLRRACDIGMGRGMDLEAVPVANELPVVMAGVCHTMQPGVIEHATRNVGSIRDFTAHPERMTRGEAG